MKFIKLQVIILFIFTSISAMGDKPEVKNQEAKDIVIFPSDIIIDLNDADDSSAHADKPIHLHKHEGYKHKKHKKLRKYNNEK